MQSAVAPATGLPQTATRYVVLTGNPNCGKTTLFNALTGLRAKVGNYPGVTVERKEGRLQGASKECPVTVLDLPGTYSLTAQSLDEQIARDVLLHRVPAVPPPSLVAIVVDASNLQRNLYFATQVIELGYPTVVALNMIDVAQDNGHAIDASSLSDLLGVPVLPIVANTGAGVAELRKVILHSFQTTATPRPTRSFCEFPPDLGREVHAVAGLLEVDHAPRRLQPLMEAVLLLSDEKFSLGAAQAYPPEVMAAVAAARHRLDERGIDWRSAPIEARYTTVAAIADTVTRVTNVEPETLSDRLDRILTHKVWGLLIFIVVMTLMFQSIFSIAEWPMKGLQDGVKWGGNLLGHNMPAGPLRSLLVDGVIAGVGAVVVFLPQICLLFLFIGLLEDTGYMARAAFLMDRLMSKVGLHGKSFIPLLSSFACAIPGIMATRTIESPKDRLVTILVAPLMSCSARLPVFTLLIAACIPNRAVLGFLKLPGLTMLSMYLLGIVAALGMAWLFKKTLLKGPTPMLIMELPPYKRPLLRVVFHHMWDRSRLFLRRAGTVILGINILLWFLATYPHHPKIENRYDAQRAAINSVAVPENPEGKIRVEKAKSDRLAELDHQEASEKLLHSFAGHLGRALEPILTPLGFDWKMGIGIVTSFAAREVFVSTMSLVYNVGAYDKSAASVQTLADTLKAQKRPDGTPVYTTLVAITLMVFYVFALQCVSTVAIVRRETNSWKWPFLQWLYMGLLAWVSAFITYQGGKLLGLG